MFVVCRCVGIQPVLEGLLAKNHTISDHRSGLAVVGSIRTQCRPFAFPVHAADVCYIEAVSDGRKGGTPDGF